MKIEAVASGWSDAHRNEKQIIKFATTYHRMTLFKDVNFHLKIFILPVIWIINLKILHRKLSPQKTILQYYCIIPPMRLFV